jgi:hypothetical protein
MQERTEYVREYNKQTYKTVKVYIPIDEYEAIKAHYETQSYKAMSGYVKALIDSDMNK